MAAKHASANPAPVRNQIGVVGAGTMGSGIALTALQADLRVVLYDLDEAALERARQYCEKYLRRKQRLINLKYLQTTTNLEALEKVGMVIEAAPEVLELKQNLFARLESICRPETILATNTSTLPVTAIASAIRTPERVGGMHFFNPAPVMPLIEVVRGALTSQATMQSLVDMARRLRKTPVVTLDTPGFIVNRVARPFYGEALRLLGEGVASHEQIDRIVRLSAGFRMGPFELMDLIGIDINYAATRSVFEQTFGEPRYRPHQIQAKMVQQKALGRKTGRGFYTYDSEQKPEDPPFADIAVKPGEGVLISAGSWAPGIVEICSQKGYEILFEISPGGLRAIPTLIAGIVAAGSDENPRERTRRLDLELPPSAPLFVQCADVTAAEASSWVEHPERLVGFDGLFFAAGKIITLTPSPRLSRSARASAEIFINTLGRQPVWVQDSPSLVMPRILSMLINETFFAIGEGVAEPETIDQAMQLGANYPRGPVAWARDLGPGRVVAVLDHLRDEYGEERYRVAPALRRLSRLEKKA